MALQTWMNTAFPTLKILLRNQLPVRPRPSQRKNLQMRNERNLVSLTYLFTKYTKFI